MGLLSKATDFLGLTGSAKAGSRASGDLKNIASGLRSQFTPVRIRSLIGDATLDPSGISYGGGLFDTLGKQITDFNEGDASQNVLNLLRQRNQQFFTPQLSGLESRLIQQGRLGLGTGSQNASPELGAFFQAQQQGDLEAQLAALGEARTQRESLLGSYTGLGSFFNQGLFGTESSRAARDLTAANIAAGGPALELKGAMAEQEAKASFWSSMFQSGAGFLMGASDKRLKSNIKFLGIHPIGVGIYEYDIFDRHEIGVMAQEVLMVKPEAVVIMPNGYLGVNYGAL